MKNGTRVSVTWIDACGGDDWEDISTIQKQEPVIIESVGYVLASTDKHITFTMCLDEENQKCGAFLCIPRINIKKIKKI